MKESDEVPAVENVTLGMLGVMFVPVGVFVFVAMSLPEYARGFLTDALRWCGCFLFAFVFGVGFAAVKGKASWRRYAALWGAFLFWAGAQYVNLAADRADAIQHKTTVVAKRIVDRPWSRSRPTAYVVEVTSWHGDGTRSYDVPNRGTYDAYVVGSDAFITTKPGALGLEWVVRPLTPLVR